MKKNNENQILTEEQAKAKKIVEFIRSIGEQGDKKQLAKLLNCKEEQIATRASEFEERNDIVAYMGDLTINSNKKWMPLYSKLMVITGSLNFQPDKTEGLENLQIVGGDLLIEMVDSTKGLKNLIAIGERITSYILEDASGLENLKYIGERAIFSELKDTTPLASCNKYEEINRKRDMRAKLEEEEINRKKELRDMLEEEVKDGKYDIHNFKNY